MKRQYSLILLFICLSSLHSCASIAPTPIHQLKYQPVAGPAQNPIKIPCCKKDITITYLGASGFLIERRDFAVLTAPFFSNPHLLNLYTPIYPNTKRIDNGLGDTSLANVKAILIGHAHYDHLMDVPYIVKKIKAQNLPEPKVFGSETMRNMILNEKRKQREIHAGREAPMDPANIVALNQKAATFWILTRTGARR
jgi:L-ascorbate metabolism protein UlaG (beta-lactamase superfamily)